MSPTEPMADDIERPYSEKAAITACTAQRIECVPITHPFPDEDGRTEAEPIWRIEIDGFCADFEHQAAADNFADAINRLVARAAIASMEGDDCEALEHILSAASSVKVFPRTKRRSYANEYCLGKKAGLREAARMLDAIRIRKSPPPPTHSGDGE